MNFIIKEKAAFATIFLFMVALLSINSCKKNNDCFDKDLYELHKNDNCPQDCPGVTGCDNAEYCNECEANKKGIAIKR